MVQGSGSIERSGTHTDIHQRSDFLATRWDSFNIAAHESVQAHQPRATSRILIRVDGGGATNIAGSYASNGITILENQNGVQFSRGAIVNVGGLLATSSRISGADGAHWQLNGTGGAVVNHGQITAGAGGVVLAAVKVQNTGDITSKGGDVALGAGSSFTVDFAGGLVGFEVKQGASGASIANSGKVEAQGGIVSLSAHEAQAVRTNVVSVGGVVRATKMERRGGVVYLSGGDEGIAEVSGDVQAGEKIQMTGEYVVVKDGATLQAPEILVGGDYQGKGDVTTAQRTLVEAGALLDAGQNGRVIVWSDETTWFDGRISAPGGFAEVSGKKTLASVHLAGIDVGHLLLDPEILNIVAAGDDVTGDIAAGDSPAYGTTNISVSAINNFTGASLTLSASRSVRVRAAISHANLNLTLRTENSDGAVEQSIELRADIDVGTGILSLESGVVTIPLVAGAAVIRTLAASGLSTSSISGLIPSSIHIRFTRAGVVGPGEGFAGGFARVAFGAEVVRVGYSYGARTSEETATDCSAQEINCAIGRINENVMAASTRLTSANSITVNIGTGNLDFTNAPAGDIVIGSGSVSIKAGGILIGARGLTIIASAGNLTLNTSITGAGSGDVVALSSTNGDLILGSQDRGVDFALEGRALTLNAGGEFVFVSGASPSAITAQAIELSGPNLPQRTPAASVITFTPRPNGRVTGGGVGAGPLPLWFANNLDQPTQTDCSGQPTDCTIRRGGRDLEISTENLTATSSITIDIEDGALTFSGTGAITISAKEVTLTAAMINLDGRDLTITGGGSTLQLNLNADIIAANTLTFGEVSESFILTLDAARTLAGANISFLSVDEITVNHTLRLHSANTLILTSNIYTDGGASDLTLGLGGTIDLRYAGEVELDSAGNLTIGGKITTDLDLSVTAGGFLVLNADIVNTGDDIHLTGTRGIILNGDRLVQNDSRNVFVESGIDDSSTSDLNLAANDSLTIKATGVNSQILFHANVNLGTGALSLTSTGGIQRNAPHITLAGGDITLPSSFTHNGVTRSFTVMASGTLTLNGTTYSAPDGITLSGTQGIMLGSQNIQLTSSAITITAPTLNANGRNLTITGSGAALTLNLNADITNAGTITIGEANHSLTLTFDAARTLTSTNIMLLSSMGISVQQSLHLHASGTLTLNSNLSTTSGNDLTLGLPETELGMISLMNVGFYQFTGGGKLTINSALIADYSVIINFAAADSDGVIELNADITGTSVSILLDGPGGIVLNGDRMLEAAGNIALRGAIDESAAMADENGKGGNDGLTVTTTGQLTLSSNINTGTGALTLRGGTISLNGGGSMSRIEIQSGTTTLTGVLTSTDNGLVVIEGAVIRLNSDIHTGAGNLHLGDISSMIILGGDITLTGRIVTIAGAVDESAAQPDENGRGGEDSLTIVAGEFITLSQDINLGAGTLTLIAGPRHPAGSVQPGSELTLTASTVSVEQNEAFTPTGLIIFMTSVLTLKIAAAQTVYDWMTQSDHDLKIIAGGDITIGGLYANMIDDVDVGTGDLILDSATQIVLYEDAILTGGAITLTGAIEGAGNSLTINAGGMLTLNNDINLGAGDLMITAHALSMSGAITITADPTVIEFTDLAIQMNSLPADTAQITFQGDASPDYIFAQSQTDCIVAICVFDWDESNTPLSPDLDAQTSITINADNAATSAANDGRLMFSGTGAITIDAPVITINASLIDTQGRQLTITTSGGALTLNADLTSAGGLVDLTSTGGAIILGGDINAGTGAITLSGGTGIGLVGDIQLIGAAITLTGTIDESSSGNDGLTATATGVITLNSNINTGAGNLSLSGTNIVLGLESSRSTDLAGGNVELRGEINEGGGIGFNITATGNITINDNITITIRNDIDEIITGGSLNFIAGMGGDGEIRSGSSIPTLTASAAIFTQDVAFDAAPRFTFMTSALTLRTTAAQTVHVWMVAANRNLILTTQRHLAIVRDIDVGTGDLTLGTTTSIVLGTDITLTGGVITLTGLVNGSIGDRALTITATGQLTLNDNIHTGTGDLTLTGSSIELNEVGDLLTLTGGAVSLTGAIDESGAGGSDSLTVNASGDITLNGDINLGTGALVLAAGMGSSSGNIMNGGGGASHSLTAQSVSLTQDAAFASTGMFTFASAILLLDTGASQTVHAWMTQGDHALSLTSAITIMVEEDVSTGTSDLTLMGNGIIFSGGARTLSGANIVLTGAATSMADLNILATGTLALNSNITTQGSASDLSVTGGGGAGGIIVGAGVEFASGHDLTISGAISVAGTSGDLTLTAAGTAELGGDINLGTGTLTIGTGSSSGLIGAAVITAGTINIMFYNNNVASASDVAALGTTITFANSVEPTYAFGAVDCKNHHPCVIEGIGEIVVRSTLTDITSITITATGEDSKVRFGGTGVITLTAPEVVITANMIELEGRALMIVDPGGASLAIGGNIAGAGTITIANNGALAFVGESIVAGGRIDIIAGMISTVNRADGINTAAAHSLSITASEDLSLTVSAIDVGSASGGDLTLGITGGTGSISAASAVDITASVVFLTHGSDNQNSMTFALLGSASNVGTLGVNVNSADQETADWMFAAGRTTAITNHSGTITVASAIANHSGAITLTATNGTSGGINVFENITNLAGGLTLNSGARPIDFGGTGVRKIIAAGITLSANSITASGDLILEAGTAPLVLNSGIDAGANSLTLDGSVIDLSSDLSSSITLTGADIRLIAPISERVDSFTFTVDARGTLTLDNDIDLGAGSLVLSGAGIALGRDITLEGMAITLTGAISETADDLSFTITAGGVVTLNSVIELTGDTGTEISITASGGEIMNGGLARTLTANRVDLVQSDEFSSSAPFIFSSVDTLNLTTNLTTSTTQAQAVWPWMVNGNLNLSLTSTGAIEIRTDISTGAGSLVLAGASIALPLAGNFTLRGFTIELAGAIDANSRGLTINASGNLTLNNDINLGAGALALTAERIRVPSAITMTASVIAINFTGAGITSASEGFVGGQTSLDRVIFEQMPDYTFSVLGLGCDDSVICRIGNGSAALNNVSSSLSASGSITIDAGDSPLTFAGTDAITITAPTIEITASVINIGSRNLTITSTGGALTLNGRIRDMGSEAVMLFATGTLTLGGSINIRTGALTLSAGSIELGTDITLTGAAISLTGAIDESGAGGNDNFTVRLAALSSGSLLLSSNINLGTGSLVLLANTRGLMLGAAITLTGGDISLTGRIDQSGLHRNFTANASDMLTLNDDIDLGPNSLVLSGANGILLIGNITLTSQTMTITAPMIDSNGSNLTLTGGGGGGGGGALTLNLNADITDAHNLTIGEAGQSLTLNLDAARTLESANIMLLSSAPISVARALELNYAQALTLSSDLSTTGSGNDLTLGLGSGSAMTISLGAGTRTLASGGDLVIGSAINSSDTLILMAGGALMLHAKITLAGVTSPSLTLTGSSITLNDVRLLQAAGSVELTGAIDETSAGNDDPSGNESLTIIAGGDITINSDINLGTGRLVLAAGSGSRVGDINNGGAARVLTAQSVSFKQDGAFAVLAPFTFVSVGALNLSTSAAQTVHDWMTDGARALSLIASGTIRVERDVSTGTGSLTLRGSNIANGGASRTLTASTVSLVQVIAFGESTLFTFVSVGTLDLTTSATQTMQAWMAQGSHSLSLTSAGSIMVGVDVSTGAGNLTLAGDAITFSGGARTLSGANISLTTDTITHSGPNLTITAAGAITTAIRNDAAAVLAAAVPSVTASRLKLTQAGEFGTDAPFVFASVGTLDLTTDAAQTMRSWMTDGTRAFSLTSAGTITIGEDISTGVGDLTLEGDAIIFSGGARTLSGANILIAADTITHNGQNLIITATGDIITANRDNTGAAVLTASGVSLTQAGEFGERTPFAFASVETLNLTTDAIQTLRPWMTDAARFLSLTSADTIMIREDVSRGDGALILAGTAITFSGGVRTLSGADITLIGSVTSAMALTITASGTLRINSNITLTGAGDLTLMSTGGVVRILADISTTGNMTLSGATGINLNNRAAKTLSGAIITLTGVVVSNRALTITARGTLTLNNNITLNGANRTLALRGAGAIVGTQRPILTASTVSLAQVDAFAEIGPFRLRAGSLVLITEAEQAVHNWMIALNRNLTLTSPARVRVAIAIGASEPGRNLGTGSLTLTSTGRDVRIEENITTTGNITLNGATGIDFSGGARILRGADLTLTGAATSDKGVRVIITGLLTLNGDIDTGTNTLILRGGAIRIVGDETDANTGTRTLTGGVVILGAPVGGVMVGRFDSSGVFLTDGPALEVEASGTVRIAADIMTGGDVMLTGGGVTPIIFAHVLTLSAANIMLNSPAVGAADLTLTASGTLTINNSITLTGAGHTLALRAGTGAIGNGGARRALMASTVSLAQVDAFGSTRDFGFAGVGSLVLTTEAAQDVHNWMIASGRNLTVTSAGSVFVRSAIGAGVAGRDFGTGSLALTSTASFILVGGNITTSGNITLSVLARSHAIRFRNAARALRGADIMLTGDVSATADLTISATSLLTLNSRMIDTGTNALTLTGAQINILSAPTGINAGTRILRGGDITLMATRRVRVGHIDGNEAVFTGGPDLEVEASGTLTIAANITARDAITLQSGAGTIGNGGQVRTLRILSAGSEITLRQVDAFGSTPLFEFGSTAITLSLDITGSGAQTIHDWMVAAIINGETLVVNSVGRVSVAADIDLGASSLTLISRASFIRLRGNITTTGDITLNGTATPENPAIRFDSAARALSGRDVLLLGNVGIFPATRSDVNVIVTASGTLKLNGVINTGASNLALTGTGGIFLLGALTLSGRDITLTGAIAGHNEGNHMLAVTAIGLLRLRSNINTGTGAVSLTGDSILIVGAANSTRTLTGGDITLRATNGVTVGRINGAGDFVGPVLDVDATGTLTIAADIAAGNNLELTGSDITLTGARTLSGADITLMGAAMGAANLTIITTSSALTLNSIISLTGTSILDLRSRQGAITGTGSLTASTVRLRQVDVFGITPPPFNFGTTGSLELTTTATVSQEVHNWMIALNRNLTVTSASIVRVGAAIGAGETGRNLGTGNITLTSTGGGVRILENISTTGNITLDGATGINFNNRAAKTLRGAIVTLIGDALSNRDLTLTASTVRVRQVAAFDEAGPLFMFGGNTGSLELTTDAAQVVHDWMIADGRNLTVTSALNVVVRSAIDLGGGALSLTSTGGEVRILANITTGGNITLNGNSGINLRGGGAKTLTGAIITLTGVVVSNRDLTLTASGTLRFNNNITLNGVRALSLTSTGGAVRILGNITTGGDLTLIGGTGGINFNGRAAKTFSGANITLTGVVVSNRAVTLTASGILRLNNNIALTGTRALSLSGSGGITLGSALTTLSGGAITLRGAVTGTADLTITARGTLTINNDIGIGTNALTLTSGAGAISNGGNIGRNRLTLTAGTVSLEQDAAFVGARPFNFSTTTDLLITTDAAQDVLDWMIVANRNLTVTSAGIVRVAAAIGGSGGRNLGNGDLTLMSTGGAVRILANISTTGGLTLNGTSGINLRGGVVGVRTLNGAIVTLTGAARSNRALTLTATAFALGDAMSTINVGANVLTITAGSSLPASLTGDDRLTAGTLTLSFTSCPSTTCVDTIP